jgi:hypothetical protein
MVWYGFLFVINLLLHKPIITILKKIEGGNEMKRLALIIVLMMVLSSTDGCSKQAEDENGVSTAPAAESPLAL